MLKFASYPHFIVDKIAHDTNHLSIKMILNKITILPVN